MKTTVDNTEAIKSNRQKQADVIAHWKKTVATTEKEIASWSKTKEYKEMIDRLNKSNAVDAVPSN